MTKLCVGCKTTKQTTEFYKDNRRGGFRSSCKKCYKNYSERNKKQITERNKQYREKHREKLNEYCKSYSKQWYILNRERIRQKKEEYRLNNKDKMNARGAIYRARKKEATPLYLIPEDYQAIQKQYQYAQYLSNLTWDKYEVDHIIPLSKGGKHTPWNLQVITRSENRAKSNKYIKD